MISAECPCFSGIYLGCLHQMSALKWDVVSLFDVRIRRDKHTHKQTLTELSTEQKELQIENSEIIFNGNIRNQLIFLGLSSSGIGHPVVSMDGQKKNINQRLVTLRQFKAVIVNNVIVKLHRNKFYLIKQFLLWHANLRFGLHVLAFRNKLLLPSSEYNGPVTNFGRF